MFKLIIKNLWSRRAKNIWLFMELIIVTVVAWAVLDTVIVNHYVRNLPLGYDMSRYVQLDMETIDEIDELQPDTIEEIDRILHTLASNIQRLPEVAGASRSSGAWLEANSYSVTTWPKDTTERYSFFQFYLYPGWDFFSLFDMKSVGKSPSLEELKVYSYSPNDVILSESGARLLFGDTNPIGHYIGENTPDFSMETAERIVGVVSDIRNHSSESDAVGYYTINLMPQWDSFPTMMIRLKDGESAQKFVNERYDFIKEELNGTFLKISDLMTLENVSDKYLYGTGYTNSMRLRYALMIFFLINLALGMTGTFLLQTRKRSEDAGIMRSFGATPAKIRGVLLGEGALLTTCACLIGFIIYFFISKSVGLASGIRNVNLDYRVDLPWISDFSTHFMIVSFIVYLIILAVVLLGIWIPAWRISRVNPVDALRDE